MPENRPEFLTRRQAGEYLNVSPGWLANIANSPAAPPHCRFGRAVRYRRADLDAWAEAHLVSA